VRTDLLTRWLGSAALLAAHVVPRGALHAQSREVVVFAAASLTEAFRALATEYQRQHPGVVVRLDFGGSQQLARQLDQGARADVFASADERWMNFVAERRLIEGPAVVFARNRLTAIVPAANPGGIRRLEDLARPGVKLVLAAEAVPAGRYAREAIARLATLRGFPPAYRQRVLANVVSEEETVRGVVAKVQLGEADAGIVYASDISPAVEAAVHALAIPDSANVTASYPIAVLAGVAHRSDARAFVALVRSAAGQELLARYRLLAATPRAPLSDQP
jgi:molybdate transport system substrate-binding protein